MPAVTGAKSDKGFSTGGTYGAKSDKGFSTGGTYGAGTSTGTGTSTGAYANANANADADADGDGDMCNYTGGGGGSLAGGSVAEFSQFSLDESQQTGREVVENKAAKFKVSLSAKSTLMSKVVAHKAELYHSIEKVRKKILYQVN